MKDILIGTILGDGYLEPHGNGVRLQVKHSQRFQEYVEWKHRKFEIFKPSKIYCCEGKYPALRFITRCHDKLQKLRDLFYPCGKKIIPDKISRLLNSNLALAVWFMDDGTIDKRQGSILFETQSFKKKDIVKLQKCLKDNFGINNSIHRSGKNRGLRIYIPVAQAKRLIKLVRPYILDCMRYKIAYPRND